MNKYFLLIALVFGVLFAACDKKEEPKPKPSTDEPAWINSLKWDEISDNDFILSEDGQTLVKWLNKKVVNLDMNRNARLKKVKTMGKEAFKKCDKLTAMVLSDEVQTLDRECFEGPDNLERIHLANVRTIGEEAFKGQKKIKELHLPKTIEKLHEEFFQGDALSIITIPEDNPKYKVVDNVLFDKEMKTLILYPLGKSGESYTIPDGVVRLGMTAFRECKYLNEIICPQSLVEIGELSVDAELRPYTVQLQSKHVVSIKSRRLEDNYYTPKILIHKQTRILVPLELVEEYKTDALWSKVANQIEAIR